jgi:phospholipid-binding lipoprotein MlaA
MVFEKQHVIKAAKLLLATLTLALVTGCASTGGSSDYKDPFEKANRSILKFNTGADRYILKPLARGYEKIIPRPVRTGVTNFFSNLWEPMTIVNDLLQGKIAHAGKDTSRFVINSTLGLLGIFDVASDMNLPKRREDFGQTLAIWGIPSGPYLVLPFLGPSNFRDTAGLVPQYIYADALLYLDNPESLYASSTRLVNTRALLLGADEILDVQPDKYLFLREAYRQQRKVQIHDGLTPENEEESEDALIDQLLQE